MKLIDADALIKFIDAGHLRHQGELVFSELDVSGIPDASKEVRICESVGKLLASVETNRARIRRACGEEI